MITDSRKSLHIPWSTFKQNICLFFYIYMHTQVAISTTVILVLLTTSAEVHYHFQDTHLKLKQGRSWMKWMGFYVTILHCKATLSRWWPGLMRWILFKIMSLVQDRSIDLWTISPARSHCVTDAPLKLGAW